MKLFIDTVNEILTADKNCDGEINPADPEFQNLATPITYMLSLEVLKETNFVKHVMT